jgi:hypothetical protein
MRPLFAIAPLALVLALIGPTPHEADQAFARFKARIMPSKVFEPSRVGQTTDKPSMMSGAPALTAMQSGGNYNNNLSR